jgi:hypothetical protein
MGTTVAKGRWRTTAACSAVALALFGGRAALLSACGGETEAGPTDAGVLEGDGPLFVIPPAAPLGGCPRRVDRTFDDDLRGWLALSQNVPGYPKIENVEGRKAAILLPGRALAVDAGDGGATDPPHARSGLWAAVPASEFPQFRAAVDLEVELFVSCTAACATRVMLAWLDAEGDFPDAAVLTNDNVGFLAGLPDGVGGRAIVLDNYLDAGPTDRGIPPPPRIQIVDVSASAPASTSAAATASVAIANGWHSLHVRLDARYGPSRTAVTVEFDRLRVVEAELPDPRRPQLAGIAAGTSSPSDAVAIERVRFTSYCTL